MATLDGALRVAIIVVAIAIIALRFRTWAGDRAFRRHQDAVNAESRERMGRLMAALHYHDGPRGQSRCFGGVDCPDGGESR